VIRELQAIRDSMSNQNHHLLEERKIKEYDSKIIEVQGILSQIRKDIQELESELDLQRAEITSVRTTSNIALSEAKMAQTNLSEGVHRISRVEELVHEMYQLLDTNKSNDSFRDSISSTRAHEGTSTPTFDSNLIVNSINPLKTSITSFLTNLDDKYRNSLTTPQSSGK